MRRTRRLLTSFLAVAALTAAAVLVGGGAPASAGAPSDIGRFVTIFAEDPAFETAPPSTVEESTRVPTAVSIAALPKQSAGDDLAYVFWNGLENLESDPYPLTTDATRVSHGSRSRQLTLGPSDVATFRIPTPEAPGGQKGDLFCADQRILLDGSVMAAGGSRWEFSPIDLTPYNPDGPGGTAELYGSDLTRIYTPGGPSNAGTWAETDKMNYGRWYPTLLTLPDGKMFIASGVKKLQYPYDEESLAAADVPTFVTKSFTNVHNTETFNPYNSLGEYKPLTGTWTDNGASAEVSLPLFARLHQLHNGKIFFGGVGQMFNPWGYSKDEALWNVMKWYDPTAQSWTDVGLAPLGARSGGVSILLPFKPDGSGNYTKSRMLVAGGNLGTSPGLWAATNLSTIITVDGNNVTTDLGPLLGNRRWYSSGVIGPTGEVFILSGADGDEVQTPGMETAVHQVEVFDPATNTIEGLATAKRDRTYHNSAILMADGRVLVGGHSPINFLYGGGDYGAADPTTGKELNSNSLHATTGLFSQNLKDPSFEIFEPPYLFRGPRPETPDISGILTWGEERTITLTASGGAEAITGAVLVKMPSTTHVTDADMRMIELPFTVSPSQNQVRITVPSNRAVATPGWYYLFLLRNNGQGPTPSERAAIVRVGDATVFQGAGTIAQAKIAEPKAALGAKTAAKAASVPVSVPAVDVPVNAPIRRPAGTLPIALVIGVGALGAMHAGRRRMRRATT